MEAVSRGKPEGEMKVWMMNSETAGIWRSLSAMTLLDFSCRRAACEICISAFHLCLKRKMKRKNQ